jgi:hypothetical protein
LVSSGVLRRALLLLPPPLVEGWSGWVVGLGGREGGRNMQERPGRLTKTIVVQGQDRYPS